MQNPRKKLATVLVKEVYKDYRPPFNAYSTVNRILRSIPQNALNGLGAIILSNSANIPAKIRNAKVRQQGLSFNVGSARAQYHKQYNKQPAWIEIWMDNVLSSWPPKVFLFSFFRDLALSETLFHEIGHHIHYTEEPQRKNSEDVAEKWVQKLNQRYYRKRYWYIMPLLWSIRPILRQVQKHLLRKDSKDQLAPTQRS